MARVIVETLLTVRSVERCSCSNCLRSISTILLMRRVSHLFALDALHHVALAPGEPLDDFLDGAPALVGELLELVVIACQGCSIDSDIPRAGGRSRPVLLALGGDALAVDLNAGFAC